jgi:hypothetical protein
MFGDALDGSIFSRRIAAFEDDQYPVIALYEMALQLDELDLKEVKHLFIRLFRDFRHLHFQVQSVLFPLFAHGMSVPALLAAPLVFRDQKRFLKAHPIIRFFRNELGLPLRRLHCPGLHY